MSKNNKIFLKLKKRYQFIFNDTELRDLLKQHYDSDGCSIGFILGLLENQIEKGKVLDQLSINKDEWLELFRSLYKESTPAKLFKRLEVNPIIPLEQTINEFNCFDQFASDVVSFLKKHEINIGINELNLKQLIKNACGYILYNNIDCKIPYTFDEILVDPDYDTKYIIVLNNTKLFSLVKNGIVGNCKNKINDLIVLVLGMSKPLASQKVTI